MAITNQAYRYTAPGFTPTADPPAGAGFTTVSCVSRTWCMAGGVFGDVTVYDGVGWSPRVVIGGHTFALALSCPTETCVSP